MKPSRFLLFAALLVGFALSAADAGGGKGGAWKPFLSDATYKELTARSIKLIEEAAKSDDKRADDRIESEAAILAGYTLSSKNPGDDAAASLRGAALQAAKAAREGKVKPLADFSKLIKSAPKAPADVKDYTSYLHATEPMMRMFLSKAKGGEGIHPDLQYQPKLKNLNGIEALLGGLANKKLSDENLGKVSKELPFLAYRLAVVSSVTHELAPKKDAAKWRELSIVMRDSSIALAEAAQKKDGTGVLKAATTLENSCIDCHSAFKNK